MTPLPKASVRSRPACIILTNRYVTKIFAWQERQRMWKKAPFEANNKEQHEEYVPKIEKGMLVFRSKDFRQPSEKTPVCALIDGINAQKQNETSADALVIILIDPFDHPMVVEFVLSVHLLMKDQNRSDSYGIMNGKNISNTVCEMMMVATNTPIHSHSG
jgi:hypothetical protein